jgi:hypothetical protein
MDAIRHSWQTGASDVGRIKEGRGLRQEGVRTPHNSAGRHMPSITRVAACRAPGWEPGAREFESLAGCLSTAWEAGAEGLKSGQTIAGVKIVKR